MSAAGGPVDEALDAGGRDRQHAAAEFDALAAGLAQRLRALEAFVADAHGPREAVRAGVVPAAVVDTNQYVEPELPAPRLWIGVYGPDVVRGGDGRLVVLEDNARTPTMLAYALVARDLVGDPLGVHPGPRPVREAARDGLARVLRAASRTASGASDPVVAVLGDGPRSAVPWEVDVLADLVGAPSVQAGDLRRRDDRLLLPDGRAVDVVWRRTDEERLRDRGGRPTELGELLLGPLRAGAVAVVNAPGTGVADDKRTHPCVDDLVRFYSGSEPLLRSVPTIDLGDPAQLQVALGRLDELVLKPRSGSGGRGVLIGPRASAEQRARVEVLADPGGWVAQEPVAISTHPTVVDGELVPRHVELRPFAFWDGQEMSVLPGDDRSWYFSTMRTTIDAAGRLVVPKALRDQLSLTAGQEVDVVVRDGRLEVEPAATRMRLVEDGDGLRAVPDVDLPPLTAEQVRETLEQVRR